MTRRKDSMKRSIKMLAAGAAAAALVVAPSAVSADEHEDPSIAEIAVGNDDFSTLVTAVSAAGLVDLLSDCEAGPFTVFAPTNDAFAALPAELLEAALADTDLLTAVLTYHVVEGTVLAADVVELSSATTVQGEDIAVDGTVLNGTVNIVATDIEACNGVVHVIDAVLLPPSLTEEAPEEEAPVEEAPAEELPATGVNNLTAGLAAAALLAGGVALIGVSRRRSIV
ncbi:MAG: fasciclin domain-containing protein [Ilumatobacter sp.]|nr:MAG: fasciclin domain-containing protein [Ilumatobacter sp.]